MKSKLSTTALILAAVLATPASAASINVHSEAPSYRIVKELDELPFKEVTDLVYDSDGLLWIATRNGLYSYDNYRMRPYRCDGRHPDMLTDNEVKRVAEDKQDRIWIGTAQGLDRLDKRTGRIEHLVPDKYLIRVITEISVTRDGTVWVASDDGFHYYLPGEDVPHHLRINDEKGDSIGVYGQCIMEDHRATSSSDKAGQHSLWVGTNEGLLQIITSLDMATTRVIYYNEEDGLLNRNLIRDAVTCDTEGTIYFGTHMGYNYFKASQLAQDKETSHIVRISELIVEDTPWQELPEDERNQISQTDPKYTEQLTFTSEQSEFTLEFMQTGLVHKKEIQFAYKLDGYDDGWRYTSGNLPRASYSNLPAGDYTFMLCSAHHTYSGENINLTNEEDIFKMRIRILPPWWATNIAKVLWAVLGILIVLLFQKGFRLLKVRYKHLLVLARERAAIRKGEIILKPNKLEVTDADKDFMNRAIQCITSH